MMPFYMSRQELVEHIDHFQREIASAKDALKRLNDEEEARRIIKEHTLNTLNMEGIRYQRGDDVADLVENAEIRFPTLEDIRRNNG